jgi:hypothetical protein
MAQPVCATRLGLLLSLALSISLSGSAGAAVVWTGPTLSFMKTGTNPTDVTDPTNQDRMTANVWITRAGAASGGIFNIAPGKETEYDFINDTSPADTLWASDLLPGNEGKTIAATNWQQLTFGTWVDAYGGRGPTLLGNITTHNAVVKLVTDDIYLDLVFTGFNNSGFFAYDRSTPATAPTTGDYNGNGLVDAADYVLWRKTLNTTVSPAGSGADGNPDGKIDAADYTFWQARFGNAAAAGSDSLFDTTVPEPATLMLEFVSVLALFWQTRTR